MVDENIKVFTPKQLNELTSSKLSTANLKGIQEMIATATGFAKEVNSLLINYQTVKGTVDSFKNKEETQIPNVNIEAKIEKGVEKEIKKIPEPKISYNIDGATIQFKQFIEMIFNSVDEKKTIKECKKEIQENFQEDKLKPIVKSFLQQHTSVSI